MLEMLSQWLISLRKTFLKVNLGVVERLEEELASFTAAGSP